MITVPVLLALAVAAPPTDRFGDPLPAGAVARLGSSRLRHPDRPLCLAFLPDGRHVVSGGADGTLRVWAVADGREVRRYSVPDGMVTALAAATDGRIAAHFADERVRVLAADSFRPLGSFRTPNLDTLAISADGSLVAGVGLSGRVFLFETATGLDRLDLPDGRAAAFTPDGKRVAVAGAGDAVTVFDVLSGEPKHRVTHLGRAGVSSIAFGPGGTHFATADTGPTARVRVWAFGGTKPLAEFVAEGPVVFSPDGRILTRRGGAVAVWDVTTGKPVRTFGAGVETFAVSADGKLVATAGAGARISLWVRESGEELRPDGDGFGTIVGLFPAPGGLMAVGPSSVARWRPGDHRPAVVARPEGGVTAAAAAGGLLVTGGSGRVSVWRRLLDAEEVVTRPARTIEVPGAMFTAAAVSPGRDRAAVGTDDRRVIVFDPRDGTSVREWPVPGVPRALAFLPAADRLVGVGWDGFARLWDVSKSGPDGGPAEVWKARTPRSLRAAAAASPDGRLVAVTSVVRVDVIDAATGRREFGFDRKWEDGPFQCVTFSADGRLIAAGTQGSRGAVTVWEVATGLPAKRLAGSNGTVARVAFPADGRHLAAAGLDDNVLIWDLADRDGKKDPTDVELTAAWDALSRRDAAVGYDAVRTLAAGGPRGVAVIRDGLADADGTTRRVRQWVAELDDPRFAVREAASKRLVGVGLAALPAVSAAAETSPSPEVRARATAVLAALERAGERVPTRGLYAEPLRRARAAWVLDLIGGPDATAVRKQIP